MQTGHLATRFLPAFRSFDAAMQSFIGLTQLAQRRFEEGLVLDSLSGAESVASRFKPTSMPTAAFRFSGTSSGISTVKLMDHQSAVRVTRAPVTLPLKRRFSAIFTQPSLGIQTW